MNRQRPYLSTLVAAAAILLACANPAVAGVLTISADTSDPMASSLPTLTVGGKQCGVPYTYYQWGVYYRKDLFEQHGVDVPGTWEEFLAAVFKQ